MGILVRKMKPDDMLHLRRPGMAWRSWTLRRWERFDREIGFWAVVLIGPNGVEARIPHRQCIDIEPGFGIAPDCVERKLKMLIESHLRWEVAYRLSEDEGELQSAR